MIRFPHAKINLGLSIVSKRQDGFHNLESIFYPLPVRDVLEIIPSNETRFTTTGPPVPGNPAQNLILKAYERLKHDFLSVGPLDIHLHKAIPMGAGLGGGSSDGAVALSMINDHFSLGIDALTLRKYALDLGSDCPFFVQNDPCYVRGRGEILEPLALDLSGYSFLLVHPDIHLSTAWAFSKVVPAIPAADLRQLIREPIGRWRSGLVNDFEKPVFDHYPALLQIRDQLEEAGALYAALSGSGSTIFGIFPKHRLPEILVENATQTKLD